MREFPERKRISGIRDGKLIVIATEGKKTEYKYFNDLTGPDFCRETKKCIHIIPSFDNKSSPESVWEKLSGFKRIYKLREHDELWLICDRDKWTNKEISEVQSNCKKCKFHFAVSNPCFEVWLLFHRKRIIDENSDYKKKVLENRRTNKKKRTFIEMELLNICGKYNKDNLDTSQFLPYIDEAIKQAKEFEKNRKDLHGWPQEIGSTVYKIVEEIKLLSDKK